MRSVLEIGTSNGYSTLWLADAVGDAGRVTTVDRTAHKVEAFSPAVAGSPGYLRSLVPIGNGELVILKEAGPT